MFPEGEAAREVKKKNKPTTTNDNTPALAYDEDLFEEYRAAMIQCLEDDNGAKKAMARHARPQGPPRISKRERSNASSAANSAQQSSARDDNDVATAQYNNTSKGYASFFDEVDEVTRRDSPMQYQ